MTTEYKDEMFNTIHNLTLCIALEITTTQIFVKTESEYLSITGYPKKALWLTQFGEMFTRIIVNPFYDNVWIPIMEEKDNLNSMDFLFGYAAMKHFFNEFGPNLAAFFVLTTFAVLNIGPFRMAGHTGKSF